MRAVQGRRRSPGRDEGARRPEWRPLLILLAALFVRCGALGADPQPIGVYLGNGATGAARLPSFSKWLGREPDGILDFFAYDSWPSFESDAAWTCASWRGTGPLPVTPAAAFSVPLTIQGTPLSEVAAGRHDSSFLAVARSMVANGWGGSVVRLGWEFNGAWMPWAAGRDTGAYVASFRRVVGLMRSVPGARFRFDWCCACGRNEAAPDSVYPGDDFVDIVGMDIYTRYYSPFNADPARRWETLKTVRFGIDWLVGFAAAHHKGLSIPEWGTGEALTPDGGTGGGDDALFVGRVARFLAENHAVYSDYWDFHAPDYNASVSDGEHPMAGAAIRENFGPGGLPAQAQGTARSRPPEPSAR
jgi:hypothetical protein